MMKKRVFSGIQPSGQLTLGNYLGAMQNQVNMQNTHDCVYCIVDDHAITVRQEPAELRQNTYQLAAWYMAAGILPEKSVLFVQSHVPAHTDCGWLLTTFSQMGELERMTQFKDKAARNKQNINAGLFTYPSLMAADILLYNTDEVPVGHDQLQHIELARNIAVRFNGIYGETFVVPKAVVPKLAARVKDLQEPERKMSKSLPGKGCVLLSDAPKEIAKKIKSAVTDSETRVAYDEAEKPGVSNLLAIYATCTGKSIADAVAEFEGLQYGAFKSAVADAVVGTLEPMQQRFAQLMADKAALDALLAKGAEQAAAIANPKLREVKEKMGFVLPR